MYRSIDVLQWIISVIMIFFVVYMMILFLPLILIIVIGFMLYVWIKSWLIRKNFSKFSYRIDIDNKKDDESKIIDAEFEILDEKIHK